MGRPATRQRWQVFSKINDGRTFPMKNEFQHLLSPFKIGNTTIKNRLTVAPMGDGYLSLLGPRGEFSWQGMEHCIQRARGGFGMMVSGCILFPDNAVEEIDPISALL